jgi:hypothetical protein
MPTGPGSECQEEVMLPFLVSAIIVVGLPTIFIAVRSREYRKFLAGAFFVSSGMQYYFFLAKIPIPLLWTNAVQSPELSGVRAAIHFVLFLVCLYFGWFFRHESPAD